MSHLVTVKTKVHDPDAVAAACRRLHLAAPVQGKAQLFSGEVNGLIVQLPEWQYPIVIETQSGQLQYDNYDGAWGNQQQLDHFMQMYAVEKAKIEAHKKGMIVSEQSLQDGSIRLQMSEGA